MIDDFMKIFKLIQAKKVSDPSPNIDFRKWMQSTKMLTSN